MTSCSERFFFRHVGRVRSLISGALASALLSFPATAFAQAAPDSGSQSFVGKIQSGVNQSAHPSGLDVNGDIMTMVGSAINVVLSIVGVLLLGYLIYAGFLWMTAGGNEDNVKKAKDIIKNCVIGLIILAVAFAGTTFVLRQLNRVVTGG
jgi:hypothetical protein